MKNEKQLLSHFVTNTQHSMIMVGM